MSQILEKDNQMTTVWAIRQKSTGHWYNGGWHESIKNVRTYRLLNHLRNSVKRQEYGPLSKHEDLEIVELHLVEVNKFPAEELLPPK